MLSCNSCAFSFSMDTNRITGTTSLSSERPPDGTASVASSFYYLPEPRKVSTVLLDPPRTSLSLLVALYRALASGLRVTAMAVRHSRGRGGKEGVERA